MSPIQSSEQFIIELAGQKLELLPEKAIYWKSRKTLMIADLHIGKVTHFRKNHIAVPSQIAEENFLNMEKILGKTKPKEVLFLGDLFHSKYNKEWEQLCFLLAKYKSIKFTLISGNHDILEDQEYTKAGIYVCDRLEIGSILLTHHPEEEKGKYNLCGHIHPAIRLRGIGKQSLKLPCFYFGENQGILPAFGNFTGYGTIKARPGDKVFAISGKKLLYLNTDKSY